MITFLYETDDTLITDLVNTAILNPDINQIENRLLDGTYNVQSIGDSLDIIEITCYVTKTNKIVIDDINKICGYIKLVKENKYYTGYITKAMPWNVLTKGTNGLYEGRFRLVVQEEGTV